MAAFISTDLELPHTSTGETDWNTLGNILTAKTLGEVVCASHVDRAYGQGSKNFQPDTDWKFMYKEDGVVAFQKSFKDSPIKAFMGRGVIDRPMDEIVHYLEDHERRKEWDRYLVNMRQVKAMSENDFILYYQVVTLNCLVKVYLEFVQYERMAYVEDKYVRTAMSIEMPEFPKRRSVIRGELKPGTGWVLEPYNGSTARTLVTYLAHVHIDLKALPPLIINRVIRRQPKAIYRIHKILSSPRRRAKSLGSYTPESFSDSFTASENDAVRAATVKYDPSHSSHQHYAEDLSIEEFIGREDRRFNPLHYHHEPDSYIKKPKLGRCVSVDSAPKSRYSSASFADENSNYHHGTPTSFKSLDPDEPQEGVALYTAVQNTTSPGKQAVDVVVELPINSNPVIKESTGFQGDNQLPFYTPSSSMDDTAGGFAGCKVETQNASNGKHFSVEQEEGQEFAASLTSTTKQFPSLELVAN